MSTPMGKIVQNIMDDGGKLAVSSRGMGSLTKKNGANYVNDDFYLRLSVILLQTLPLQMLRRRYYGRKEWVWNNGLLQEQEVAIKDEMERNVRSRSELPSTRCKIPQEFIITKYSVRGLLIY